jgi:hypothetical protein
MVVVAAGGCGRTASDIAGHGIEDGRPPAVRVPGIVPQAASARARAFKEGYMNGLSADTAKKVVDVACKAIDVGNVLDSDSIDNAVTEAGIAFGGNRTAILRAKAMAHDLANKKSSADADARYLVGLVCE